MNATTSDRLYNPIELPSLEEIQEMDKLRQEAIESLQLSHNGDSVRCQDCHIFIPIFGKLSRPHHDRISALRNRIRWAEQYCYNKADVCKQEREELAELLREDDSKEFLRRLPLYSCKITGWKFVCSKCWDKVYRSSYRNSKA